MRDFILNHSESLFTINGYKNTSMDMIAEKCEISKPTLYNYFESKSSLFLELFTRFQSEMAEKSKSIDGTKKRISTSSSRNLSISRLISFRKSATF